jgi:hypothetical protein
MFTYYGQETRAITKLFKDANIKIALRTKNTIQNLIRPHQQQDKYEKSGVYQMKCMDCPLKYIGQTGRTFKTRYKEHIQAIRNNNGNSGYSNHMLNTRHSYGSMTDTMEVVKTERKGRHLNTLKKYYIYKTRKQKLQMNDACVDIHNPIFEVMLEINNR